MEWTEEQYQDEVVSEDVSQGASKKKSLWSVATLVLGGVLWVQLFWLGLSAEVQFAVPRPWALIAYLLPLAMLAAGVVSRAPVLLLTLFAGSLLPGLVLLAEPERMMLMEGGSLFRVGVSFALFLAIASAGSGSELSHGQVEVLDETQASSDVGLQRFVLTRLVVLVLLWCIPAYGVYLDPDISRAISINYGDSSGVGQVFLGVVHFFIWSVGAYMMVLVPALNVEYDRRRLGRELRQYAKNWGWKNMVLRIAFYGVVAFIACLIIFGLN